MRHSWLRRTRNHQTSSVWTCLTYLWHFFLGSHLPYSACSQATLRRHQIRLSLSQQQIIQLQARRLALCTSRQGCSWPPQRHAASQPNRTKIGSRCAIPLILPWLDLIINTGEDFLPDFHWIWLFKEIKEEEDVPLLLINSVLLIPSSIHFYKISWVSGWSSWLSSSSLFSSSSIRPTRNLPSILPRRGPSPSPQISPTRSWGSMTEWSTRLSTLRWRERFTMSVHLIFTELEAAIISLLVMMLRSISQRCRTMTNTSTSTERSRSINKKATCSMIGC